MQLLRNFATVGAFTALSRVLGFIRDVMMAAVLGAGPVADAFFVAFKLPNLFRRLFAEGAFNSAFVPLLARADAEGGAEEAERFASDVLSWLLVFLIAAMALAQLFAPVLVGLLAPGFADDGNFDLTVVYARICFPYLAAMSLVAFLSGILNTAGRFALAAFAPVLLNIVLISSIGAAGILGLPPREAAFALSWGVFVAGAVQAMLLTVGVARLGVDLRMRWPRRSPRLKRMLMLGLPGIAAGGVTQINIVAGTVIASFWPGAVSYLYYADRLYQLPLGVVGIAIGVALLPDLSRRLRSGDKAGALRTQNRALEFALMLTLPAAAALIVVPVEIVITLFERGAFTRADTALTAAAVAAYGFGLPAFVLIKVLSPAFFAREDTATPLYFAAVSMVVNVVGSIAFAQLLAPQGLAHVGIAAATSLAGWVNTLLLFVALLRRGHFVIDALLCTRALGFLAASLALMIAATLIARGFHGWFFDDDLLRSGTALIVLVAGSVTIFFLMCEVSGTIKVREMMRALRRRD